MFGLAIGTWIILGLMVLTLLLILVMLAKMFRKAGPNEALARAPMQLVRALREGVRAGAAGARALAAEHDAATHDVREWMTKDPVTLDADTSAQETLALMLAKGFRHVPVTETGRLVGIVSMRDLSIR